MYLMVVNGRAVVWLGLGSLNEAYRGESMGGLSPAFPL